jgi:hypothetical protein
LQRPPWWSRDRGTDGWGANKRKKEQAGCAEEHYAGADARDVIISGRERSSGEASSETAERRIDVSMP